MVKGIGIDIVEIRRIEECIEKYGEHFLRKVFTEQEIAYCRKRKSPAVHFAGRWAAKEAFFKALPWECQAAASWKCVRISAAESGRPVLELCDAELGRLLKKASVARFHLSISHERTVCAAFVVAE
jgi:holo-[acyl-carrier protein] synthase